jgi:hypothetical protein
LTLTEEESTLKFLKTTAEVAKDETIMEEVVVDLVAEEAQVVLEVIEIQVEKEEVREVSDHEVVEIEVRLQNVKADLEAKEVLQLREKNLVHLKEKEVLKDQLVVRLTMLKQEDQEEASFYYRNNTFLNSKFQ